jgi:4-diphosphocytidyl-2-C-methyl-D-erythritol kinase
VTSRTDTVREFARAKINLFLHVGDKRSDGFHDLESLVVFADAGDVLEFAPADELSLSLAGPFAISLQAESDNLVLRAARALAARAKSSAGATITLTKNLPVASGIGGGSADAAATLRGLAKLWKLNILAIDLRAIAEELGSDVPVCIESQSAWMEGRGERVTPAPRVPGLAMVLVNPGLAVPTADVFRGLKLRRGTGAVDHASRMAKPGELIAFLKTTANDLEAPTRAIAAVIGEVLSEISRMPGIELWRMSGSGATCFGLFEDAGAAQMAAIALSHSHPKWWVQATRIAS